jgi:serralysin
MGTLLFSKPTILLPTALAAASGAFNLNGQNASFGTTSPSSTIAAAEGTFALTGEAAALATGTSSLLIFDLQWEASANAAPAGFKSAVQQAADLLSAACPHTSMTLRVQVGYNDLSSSLGIGTLSTNLGSSAETIPNNTPNASYSAIRAALAAKNNPTSTLTTWVSNLPTGSTYHGANGMQIMTGCAKALGLFSLTGGPTSSTDATIDAYMGIGSSVPSSVLVGVALHELSHAMGRIQSYALLELSRFTASNAPDFGSNTSAYFSIDNGVTKLANYGSSSDVADFLNGPPSGAGIQDTGGTYDAFDEFYDTSLSLNTLTAVDIQLLNCLGYT